MNESYHAMKALLSNQAPKGLRWAIERARDADHQQTPIIALPSALYEYFAVRPQTDLTQQNRAARVTGGSGARQSR
jgi:hypothetical protein